MLTRYPSGTRSTMGKPGPGPALNPTDAVTMPGAANAAGGASNAAAIRMLLSFMTRPPVASRNVQKHRAFRTIALTRRKSKGAPHARVQYSFAVHRETPVLFAGSLIPSNTAA